jgi:hypothetical protein
VVSFTVRLLYPQQKGPWYPLDRRLGGPQSRSGRGGEKKNTQPLPGLESPIFQPVAQRYTIELSRLLFHIHFNIILPSTLGSPRWSLAFLIPPVCATCPAHLTIIGLIALVMFDEDSTLLLTDTMQCS